MHIAHPFPLDQSPPAVGDGMEFSFVFAADDPTKSILEHPLAVTGVYSPDRLGWYAFGSMGALQGFPSDPKSGTDKSNVASW